MNKEKVLDKTSSKEVFSKSRSRPPVFKIHISENIC